MASSTPSSTADIDISTKIDMFQKQYQYLVQEALKDEDSRKKLLLMAMEGVATLESPVETIWRFMMSPHQYASLMSIIKMGALQAVVQSEKPLTAAEISKKTGADALLIVRLMRVLTALGIFKETDAETYTSTPISQTIIAPPLIGGLQYVCIPIALDQLTLTSPRYAGANLSLAKLPYYLEKSGFKNVSGSPGPFEDALDFPEGFFPWLIANPEMLGYFNAFMSAQRQNRKEWYDFFPVDQILFNGYEANGNDSTLMIDIGGGEGHDSEVFHKKFPNAPGRLVLQDLPATIDHIKQLHPAVTPMKYDFFTEQPVKGARAYYFRSIFHDWPDAKCVEIMKNTAAAMKKGYSKLLIFEFVLPEKNTPLYPALLDINMMALLNGMERTKAQWTALLEAANLEVVKFWSIADDSEALIEAQLK